MRRAFSLVEVLVVVGVIAVLVALGVPAFRTIQARAQTAQCLGNLRQIGIALNAYLGEHQMIMPVMVAARASRDEDAAALDNTLLEYMDSAGAFACPAGRAVAEATGTSYYWNSVLNGQAIARLNMFGLITDLGKIPITMDKEGWHEFGEDKVNHLFADGHAEHGLRMFTE